jgi:ketosteroid isomerase-like protein
MSVRTVVDNYYELANAGEWDAWCELFAPDQVMDEQLAGHIEGRDTLRAVMKGFPDMYARFANVPRYVIIDRQQAAVFSHISAASHTGAMIEADVSNYFRIVDDRIVYMTNTHDTVPFAPVLAR